MIDVSITMVNWNTRDELRECLRTILQQDGAVTFEAIVVDNASSDGSAEMVEKEFSGQVKLIRNDGNAGFAAGQNEAIEHSQGRYVMLLNPDCRFLEVDSLTKMVQYMDENPGIGILGPKIINPDGTLQFSARRFPTMFAAGFRHTILGKLFPKNRFVRSYMMTDWAHDQVADVDWLSGSALMVRREVIEQVGDLDERFYMYCEDVDWCKRAHLAGWRVVYFPMTTVTHRIGAASDRIPIEMIRQHHKSMLRYWLKHDAKGPRILLTPLVVVALWIRQTARMRLVR